MKGFLEPYSPLTPRKQGEFILNFLFNHVNVNQDKSRHTNT